MGSGAEPSPECNIAAAPETSPPKPCSQRDRQPGRPCKTASSRMTEGGWNNRPLPGGGRSTFPVWFSDTEQEPTSREISNDAFGEVQQWPRISADSFGFSVQLSSSRRSFQKKKHCTGRGSAAGVEDPGWCRFRQTSATGNHNMKGWIQPKPSTKNNQG